MKKNLISKVCRMDHCCPLRSERIFSQIVASIKKPTCITLIIISLTFVVVGSNLIIMIHANPLTLKIIVLGSVGNSTSLKVETLDWILLFMAHHQHH